ncbi:hypothetical protein HanRHA438_Chr05g0220351 [Helianthus annuus]|nr:hypothetical protein HanRHA438_Chr05g0220351 [Helianthus annuus]
MTNEHRTMKAEPHKKTHRATSGDRPVPESATARASRIQAAMSLTAAADMASLPTSVVRSLSSARIRASTGKAVMDIATPMNTINGPWLTPLETVPRRTKETPIPKMNGREIPAMATHRAFFPVRLRDFKSSSRPTRKRKNRSPRLANVSKTGRLLLGKTA